MAEGPKNWGQDDNRLSIPQPGKGQLISKANCKAMDSSKKRTNEFALTSIGRVFVRFLEESTA